jgi:type IV pilus assembly protein PilV
MTNNCSGFTLVEFLVAIVILMVGMLGLLQSINVAMDKNSETMYRNEAIMLADQRMMGMRAKGFKTFSGADTVHVFYPPSDELRPTVRGIQKQYSVCETIQKTTSNSQQIIVNVSWKKKNTRYSHSVSSFVSTY